MTLAHTCPQAESHECLTWCHPVILLFLSVHFLFLPLQPVPGGDLAPLTGRKNPWQALIISAPGNHGLFTGTMSPKRQANVPVSSESKAGGKKRKFNHSYREYPCNVFPMPHA